MTDSEVKPGRVFIAVFASALVEPVAVAVLFQDIDRMCQMVRQRPGQPFGAEHLCPLVEGKIASHPGGATIIALVEHLEQEMGAGEEEKRPTLPEKFVLSPWCYPKGKEAPCDQVMILMRKENR